MQPLLVNAFDTYGGASIAASRLLKGLREIGLPARMLVQTRYGDSPHVLGPKTTCERAEAALRPFLDQLPLRVAYPRRREYFSPALTPDRLGARIRALDPDVVHLHWLAAGMAAVESLGNLRRPVVWTLHDMWPLTGGCHYDADCGRFVRGCGLCPALGSQSGRDLSAQGWKRKQQALACLRPRVVAPSRWLAEQARKSPIFQDCQIDVIPNGLDLTRFRPFDRQFAREVFDLPKDRPIVLFGALAGMTDARKGGALLKEALGRMAHQPRASRPLLVVFGASHEELGDWDHRCMGHLADEVSLALLYSAADVLVAPSRQDNLPNTVLEALACGLPVVAFEVGGMRDLILHRQNGFLAEPFDTAALAAGIQWVLEDRERHDQLRARARESAVVGFELKTVAQRYAALYAEVGAAAPIQRGI